MKPLQARQRVGAVAMAIGITFSIVWALSSYAYERPADVLLAPAAMPVRPAAVVVAVGGAHDDDRRGRRRGIYSGAGLNGNGDAAGDEHARRGERK